MSQYLKLKIQVQRRDAAVAALRALGFEPELSEQADLRLTTYSGTDAGAACHVRVRRDKIGSLTNDFGINLDTGQVWLCDYARRTKLGEFLQEYSTQALMATYQEEGRYCYRVEDAETGKTHVFVSGG
jgi:hypothetical protein